MRTHNNFHILIMTKTKLIVSHRGQAHLHPTTPLPPTRWQSSWRARRSSPCLPRSQSSVGSGLTSHLDKGCLAPVCISRKWSLSSCLEPPLLLEMVAVKIISDQFQGEKLIWGQRQPFNHQDLSNWTVKIWSDGALPRLWKGRGNKQKVAIWRRRLYPLKSIKLQKVQNVTFWMLVQYQCSTCFYPGLYPNALYTTYKYKYITVVLHKRNRYCCWFLTVVLCHQANKFPYFNIDILIPRVVWEPDFRELLMGNAWK